MRGPVLFVLCFVVAATVAAVGTPPHLAEGARGPLSFLATADDDQEQTIVPIERQDALDRAAHACLVARSCQMTLGERLRDVTLPEAGDARRLDVEVSWTSTSRATLRLVAEVLACVDACSEAEEPLTSSSGVSPLALEFDAEDGLPARGVTLRVRLDDALQGPSELYVSPGAQPFVVTGTATLR